VVIVNDTRQSLGKEGEQLAEQYLKKKGYTIVERNYRCVLGEVDLIALDRRIVVFVEVKTRTGHAFGMPAEAVERKKQQKMIHTAQFFISSKKLHQRDARFDVVAISWFGQKPVIEHIKNAFQASWA
jgi:putative endonuclease